MDFRKKRPAKRGEGRGSFGGCGVEDRLDKIGAGVTGGGEKCGYLIPRW